jgi:hypothetical protein
MLKLPYISVHFDLTMLSTSSAFAGEGEASAQSSTPNRHMSKYDQVPKISDVPCYTCRRRHVKCDRLLPNW